MKQVYRGNGVNVYESEAVQEIFGFTLTVLSQDHMPTPIIMITLCCNYNAPGSAETMTLSEAQSLFGHDGFEGEWQAECTKLATEFVSKL